MHGQTRRGKAGAQSATEGEGERDKESKEDKREGNSKTEKKRKGKGARQEINNVTMDVKEIKKEKHNAPTIKDSKM